MLAADKIKRLNRLYAVSSGINEAIVRAPNEERLYLEACRIAVERGGFLMAWVGRHDPARGRLVPIARWGHDDGYVDSIAITTDQGTRAGQGPGGTAFRTGEAAVCNDIDSDEQFFAFRSEALARGFRSCAAFPLKLRGQPFAVFLVYSSEPLYFDEQELALLGSLAENFSFAIEVREREAERARMVTALRESETRLRAVIENEPECVKVLSAEGKVLDINPAGLRMLQAVAPEQVLGRNIIEFVHDEDKAAYTQLHERVMRGETARLRARAVGLKGRIVWVDTHGVPLRPEGGAVDSVLCLTQDISAQQAHEQEILRLNAELEQRVKQRTAQLEEANRELQAFSYSVAHDLRAPLMAIGGFSQALEGELPDDAGGRIQHYVRRMRDGVQRTSEMIDALLSLAQLSRTELRWEDVDLSALAQRAIDHCREQSEGRSVSVEVQPGMAARGDARLLQLVMDNLLGNAFKFTEGVAEARIEVRAEAGEEGETIYSVRDNGVGFDMAYAGNLFGAFQRLHSQSEFPGTGIGLANVRRIVSRHSGRIWADSAPGAGATFFFTLGDEPA